MFKEDTTRVDIRFLLDLLGESQSFYRFMAADAESKGLELTAALAKKKEQARRQMWEAVLNMLP